MAILNNRAVSSESLDAPTHAMLIDADVHEMLGSVDDLLPHLPPHFQRYITEYRWRDIDVKNGFPYAPPFHPRRDWMLPDGTLGTNVDYMRSHLLETEGVTIAILNGFFYVSAMLGDYEFAGALASAYNDWQIENWLEKEPRLRGSVHVVAQDPQLAAREIDRVASHPQIVQVFLPTVTDRQYGDPFYRPIFEAALRNELVIAFHHGFHTRTLLGYPRYYIEWHTVAAPQAAMNQLLSIICNGLFDKYPDLKVVFLETGVAWLPWFMWRLDQQYRELRTEVPWVKRLPSEHMRNNVRLATQPMGDIQPQQFRQLVEMTDSECMFLFSTDYPHYDADSANNVLPSSLPESLRNRIRYQNALQTFPRLRVIPK